MSNETLFVATKGVGDTCVAQCEHQLSVLHMPEYNYRLIHYQHAGYHVRDLDILIPSLRAMIVSYLDWEIKPYQSQDYLELNMEFSSVRCRTKLDIARLPRSIHGYFKWQLVLNKTQCIVTGPVDVPFYHDDVNNKWMEWNSSWFKSGIPYQLQPILSQTGNWFIVVLDTETCKSSWIIRNQKAIAHSGKLHDKKVRTVVCTGNEIVLQHDDGTFRVLTFSEHKLTEAGFTLGPKVASLMPGTHELSWFVTRSGDKSTIQTRSGERQIEITFSPRWIRSFFVDSFRNFFNVTVLGDVRRC
jgi:hypothetical protein